MATSLDDLMAEILSEMGDGPKAHRLATAIGALVRASALPQEEAWCAMARIVSLANHDAPAAVRVILPGESEGSREVVTFHANGGVEREPARSVATIPAGDGGPQH